MNTQVMTGKDYAEWLLSEVLEVEAQPKPVEPKRIMTEAEMEAELEDLREGMDDEAFWRNHCN